MIRDGILLIKGNKMKMDSFLLVIDFYIQAFIYFNLNVKHVKV